MKKTTEIIFNDELIDTYDDSVNLKKGDVFYFSKRGPHPKAESDYYKQEDVMSFPKSLMTGFINHLHEDCSKYHIRKFKVKSVSKSCSRDYGMSISNPKLEYTESIEVFEYRTISEKVISIIRKLKKRFK